MSQLTIFQLCLDVSSWVEPVLSNDKSVLSCSRTQHIDAGEARTCSPSVSSSTLTLSHCAPYLEIHDLGPVSSNIFTGPGSTVGNVSGYRCVSDCRSRGRKFDSGPVPYFRGD